jgi:hypothetical protein
VEFPLASYYFILLGSKYSPQHPVVQHHQFELASVLLTYLHSVGT